MGVFLDFQVNIFSTGVDPFFFVTFLSKLSIKVGSYKNQLLMLQQVDIEGDLFAYFLAFEVSITILQHGESD